MLFANQQTNLSKPYHSHNQSTYPSPVYPYRSIQDYRIPDYITANTSGPVSGSRQHESVQNDGAVFRKANNLENTEDGRAGSGVLRGQTEREDRNQNKTNYDNGIKNISEKWKGQKVDTEILSDSGSNEVREESLIAVSEEAPGKRDDGGGGDKDKNMIQGKKETAEEETKPTEHISNTELNQENMKLEQEAEVEQKSEEFDLQIMNGTFKQKVEAILRREREKLKKAMEGYTFHPNLKAKTMGDLIQEEGGQPVRNLIITTWRSGSTFMGDVLSSHPATFYHYEPLLDFGIHQIRNGDNATQAIFNLRHLLKCNYTDMEHYLKYGPEHPWLFNHNSRLWSYCTSFPEICYQPEFLSPFCRLYPFQSLKAVRLRLNLTTELLKDKKLDVRVLLLVRDPRGTIQSRHHRVWCPDNPDCNDPVRLCQDLVDDYKAASILRKQFPHSIRVIRYEDLAFDVYNTTKDLFNFFRLSYHSSVQKFLNSHTKKKIGGASSTFRDSKAAAIHWQWDLSWQEVDSIQRVCSNALRLWGYEIATDENHLRTYMPVGTFKYT
ncbi:hypothetical protein Pcinc_025137 [Petrolisthes cinctipes]|uniref:Sulfotransferase domain-containing protein n=1 Tax=Petrolisthes cinctipes TaxID=88211 RepID=A0AAE1FB77_PETCI|nr:hypothetical protein Pcinc_025137 [Petrolisthes cinctipes]